MAENFAKRGVKDKVGCPECDLPENDGHLLTCVVDTAQTRKVLQRKLDDSALELVRRWRRKVKFHTREEEDVREQPIIASAFLCVMHDA